MPSFILQIVSSSPNLKYAGSTERSSYNWGNRGLLLREGAEMPHQYRDTEGREQGLGRKRQRQDTKSRKQSTQTQVSRQRV